MIQKKRKDRRRKKKDGREVVKKRGMQINLSTYFIDVSHTQSQKEYDKKKQYSIRQDKTKKRQLMKALYIRFDKKRYDMHIVS